MDKKIYVLRNGDNPGICLDWLDFFQRIDGRKDVEYKIITYNSELEDADESVLFSMKWAFKVAREFLATEEVADSCDVENTDSTETYSEADAEEEEIDDDDDEIHPNSYAGFLRRKLLIEEELHLGSVWLDFLVTLAGKNSPRFNEGSYSGGYFARTLYGLLLALILDPYLLLDEAYAMYASMSKEELSEDDKQQWYYDIKLKLFWEPEYKELESRFKKYGLDRLDVREIRKRNAYFTKNMNPVEHSQSYNELKRYLKSGSHTIVDLYHELTSNPVHRVDIMQVSWSVHNPDLDEKTVQSNENITLERLITQSARVRSALKQVIVGQDEAIDKLDKSFFHSEKKANINDTRGPRCAYLFAGPPGVGKTYMAETFAKVLGIPYRKFDMSVYGSLNAMEEIVGISSFYNKAKAGVLTSYVKKNPKSVLLFDEIEKASIDVIRLFLQILDEGTCTDRYYDEKVSFKDCIIIMTTNAGKQLYEGVGNESLTEIPDKVVIDTFRKDIDPVSQKHYFPPEIVSRMASHTIIMFNHLKADAIRRVIQGDVEKTLQTTGHEFGLDLSKGIDVLSATIQYSVGAGGDARNASKLGGKLIDKELYEFWALVEEKYGAGMGSKLKQITWECDLTDCSDEIKEFYLGEKDCTVPVLKATDKEHEISISERLRVKVVNDIDAFMEIIRNDKVLYAVIDYAYGLKNQEVSISIADTKTIGARAFEMLKAENADIPIYLLKEDKRYLYSESEKRSLFKAGAEDFIDENMLAKQLIKVYADVCCQNAMEHLRLRHQVLTYATRQEINDSGTAAKIVFYNMKLEMAVDGEDKGILISDELRPDKKWADVFISDDIRRELEFFVSYLTNPKEYVKTGARAPKGVLMFGPPGTGKTSLAKVVASESNVNFLSVSADELLNGGAALVHEMFRVARKYAPAVFFIDEIDAIGVTRSVTGANATLNALLTEMDGFKRVDSKPVFVMAATNLKGIDAALARRFDRTFVVDLPNEDGRRWLLERLLKLHGERFCISEKEKESLVARSRGLSPADLENIIETALREAIRNGGNVDDDLLDEIFEKCNYGEQQDVNSEEEIEHTAYHEAGHALIELYYGRIPEYMSVIARGNFGGYVQPEKTNEHPTKERLLQRICTMLGGRAAELEFDYGLTPGASSDLQAATRQAVRMVCEYGMYEEEIGLAVISEEEYAKDDKARALVNAILKEQLIQARAIVREKKDAMRRLVHAVVQSEQKYLTKKDILKAYAEENAD